MAAFINLTPAPVKIGSPGVMPEKEVLDVSGIQRARFSLRLYDAALSGPLLFEVVLEGNMSRDELGWIELAAFPPIDDTPAAVTVALDMPLVYLRWKVNTMDNCSTALFQINGIGWP